jgi:ubiquinone/menaquinone biosynthesis C-methylase UbiE
MGRVARRKLRAHGLSVPLVRARVQALPFAAASFPSLVATFPTEFIVDPAAIAEFQRVLQPGGVIVSVPVARLTGPAPLERLAQWLFRVTGQSSETWFAPLTGRYAAAGFAARIERVRLPRSEVVVIVAEIIPVPRAQAQTAADA